MTIGLFGAVVHIGCLDVIYLLRDRLWCGLTLLSLCSMSSSRSLTAIQMPDVMIVLFLLLELLFRRLDI